MKKLFLRFLLTSIVFSVFITLSAQDKFGEQKLPVDSKVRIGKLANGFTYYIRTNQKPEKRLEMRLAVNAGSILESDNQQGLAHFIEHMCFNGTAHFAKNDLVQYLQSIGVRFGADLNAYTSFDETVYKLTIPSDSTNLIEKGFLVMEDWAHNVTFDSTEIDKERGVIVEEWRLGRGPWQRLTDKFLPVVFKDSHYAVRLPIGKKEVIEGAPYDTLRGFYKDWYRPDLMALVIVGDIDPDQAEKKIREHFSSLKMPEKPKARKEYDIPNQPVTLITVASDKEQPYCVLQLIYKSDVKKFETYADYLEKLKYSCLTGMLNRRLSELTENENPPFITSAFEYGDLWVRAKEGLQGYAIVGEKGIERGLQTLLVENKRLSQYGFTQGEFDRFKLDLLKQYENAFNERDKTESQDLVGEYIRNFLEKEPIPGIEFEYEFVKNNLQLISLESINTLSKELITDRNRVIVVSAPEKEGVIVPSEDNVFGIAHSVDTMKILPYIDKFSGEKLLSVLPEPGKIVSEQNIAGLDARELMLSNGAKIILKPTIFKNDEIILSAFCLGGHSVYPDKDHFTAMNADGIVQEGGISNYSPSDIDKILAGKSVYVAPVITYNTEEMTASSQSMDIESMFQLLYLYFTNPRVDNSAFNSYISKKKELYQNLAKEPLNYFYDQYSRIKAQNHLRGDYLPKPEDWDKIDYKRAIDIYKDRFADAGGFTFLIIGSFSIDSVKPLIERYIGSLPSIKRTENFVDLGIRPPKDKQVNRVFKGNDPKSRAILYFEEEKPWNDRDAFMVDVLGDILEFRYIEKLREEMSGVYTVRVGSSLRKIPYSHSSLQITMPCAPDNVDSLVNAAIAEIRKIQVSGVEEKEIIKAKETRKRALESDTKTNKFWLAAIEDALLNDTDLGSVTNEKYIDQISSQEIQRVAKEYFNIDTYLEVVLYPEEYKAKLEN
jgi:zinc protease